MYSFLLYQGLVYQILVCFVTVVMVLMVLFLVLSVKLLSLIFELARNSMTYMYQIVQVKALELIGNLLEKVGNFKH